ncbi:UNVERIFIED_ORG: hypothetical protein ABIC58_000204 [Leuconostoc holzapfelii]
MAFDKLITVQEIVGKPGPLDKAPENPKVGDIWMKR